MSTGFEKIGSDQQLQDHWLRRLIAFIIDSIIVSAVTLTIAVAVSIPFIVAAVATGLPWYVFNLVTFPFLTGVASVLYFALLEHYYGWTFGKKVMNLKTVNLDEQKPALNAAFIRNISKIYWILIILDIIIGLATPGDPHQKVSDRTAGTTVVSTTASPTMLIRPQAPARFCPHCGQRLSLDAEYCLHCGKKLE